ncbi:MAG: cobalamin-independent methionine synthase II family protein [Chloroflexota bacterium]
MQRSSERILTTHAGSLPRPDDVLEMLRARRGGELFERRVRKAVAEIVRQQRAHGLDVVDDGEVSKPSFVTYATERLGGLTTRPSEPVSTFAGSREYLAFPEFYAMAGGPSPGGVGRDRPTQTVCTGPISYTGHDAVKRDVENLKAAVAGSGAVEAFLPAISPSNVQAYIVNEHYASEEEFQVAIADALHEEYKAIADAGLLVQIDDPRLVTQYIRDPSLSLEQCRAWAERHVEILNHALRGIPEDRIRFHTCYSINMGPRVHDMQLKDIVDVILKIRAGAYSFEAANPRHEHEWQVWETVTLPKDKVLIPGVITQSTVLVEHPTLVAQRLARFASIVGRERVIAGADCGFATFAGSTEIHPTVAWAKLDALVEGARLASARLWT